MELIKSVQTNDQDILTSISQLYLNGEWYDLDPCYSTGRFYQGLQEPRIKMDATIQSAGVIQNDLINGLPVMNTVIGSIVFDPPFMFGTHGQTKNNLMNKRFSMFDTWEELEKMYKSALFSFYRTLKKGGIVAFKCQDYTDSKTTLTHCYVHNWAIEAGFTVEDLFILYWQGGRIYNPNLKQKHARKFHSYWMVLKK